MLPRTVLLVGPYYGMELFVRLSVQFWFVNSERRVSLRVDANYSTSVLRHLNRRTVLYSPAALGLHTRRLQRGRANLHSFINTRDETVRLTMLRRQYNDTREGRSRRLSLYVHCLCFAYNK